MGLMTLNPVAHNLVYWVHGVPCLVKSGLKDFVCDFVTLPLGQIIAPITNLFPKYHMSKHCSIYLCKMRYKKHNKKVRQ